MAFLAPLGEMLLTGIEGAAASGIATEAVKTFAPPIKNVIADETGKIIGKTARDNPTGIVNQTLDSAYLYKKRPHHHHKRHKRTVG